MHAMQLRLRDLRSVTSFIEQGLSFDIYYVYIYIYIYTHTYIYICVYVYIYTCI